jgi:hypothetical protein
MFFDHGILGILFVFYSLTKLLQWSNVPNRSIFAALMILFLNGLSVSSVNSVFALLGLIILLTSAVPKKQGINKELDVD